MPKVDGRRLPLMPAHRIHGIRQRRIFGLLYQVGSYASRERSVIAEEERSLIHDFGRHEGTCQFEAHLRAVELTDLCPSNLGADRIERVNHGHQSSSRREKRDRNVHVGKGTNRLGSDLYRA